MRVRGKGKVELGQGQERGWAGTIQGRAMFVCSR